jgi:glutamate-5-semialdehyde dehydrogenase
MTDIVDMAKKAREASRRLAGIPTDDKNQALLTAAREIKENAASLQEANQKDLSLAREKGLPAAMIDRLTLSDATLLQICRSLEEVTALPDPVGEIVSMWRRPNGLQIGKMRIPLGVIGIIYEARPNVTVDAAALCLKSGNAVLLRGGSEAIHSNRALASLLARACGRAGLPEDSVQLIGTTDRAAVLEMLKQEESIDLIIPRGGEGLIRFVVENSKIPVLKHYKGVCHVYVDQGADPEMAVRICVNAKAQRPGVCNATETILIHETEAEELLPKIADALRQEGVEIRGCPATCARVPHAKAATQQDWGTEYLDLIVSMKVVGGMEEAMDVYARNPGVAVFFNDEPAWRFGKLMYGTREKNTSAAVQQFLARPDVKAFVKKHRLSVTPEILLDTTGRYLETTALAGTLPLQGQEGLPDWSDKERREQQIVSDYILGVLETTGFPPDEIDGPHTIIAGRMAHLETTFRIAVPRQRRDISRLVQALHPTPAICGYPREEALALIRETEGYDRQYYTGYLGPWNTRYPSRLYINLRSMHFLPGRRQAVLYAGGGITAASVPEKEWEETTLKMNTLLSVLENLPNFTR